MITVALHGAEFFARHGFYPEEQTLGGKFTVDIDVSFQYKDNLNEDDIAHTVNYEQLYEIASIEMKNTRKLIETVCASIIEQIKEQFVFVENIRVAVKKLNPPLQRKVAYSTVVMNYNKPQDGL